MASLVIARGGYSQKCLVGVCGRLPNNDEKVASSKKHTQFMSIYPIEHQNAKIDTPIYDKNG